MGMTSSDVIDTAMALQMRDAGKIILKDLDEILSVIKAKAIEHKETVCIGRSHGIHAEPMTFGVKLCGWIDLFERNKRNLEKAMEEIQVGQISGPVGTYSNISPEIEKLTMEFLGLKPAKFSTQVIARDIHAQYIQALSLIACAIEQIAIELRHLQRTEVLEVEEGFKKGQKGSSAMPHKKNPISGENLSGLARVVRSNSITAMENIALWHERDISHSSAERIIFPDSTILVDYMLNRLSNTIENLVVHKDNMLKNTNLFGGIVFSQKVLLKLCDTGMMREDAYKLVVEGLAPLGKEYQDLLIKAKEQRWLDVYEKDGKRSGAYSVSAYTTHPYVLLNYQKTTHDVFTIAHELGHSLHSYFSNKTQPYAKADYTIFVAEVASTVNEVLLIKHLLSTATDKKLKK